jgi:hypothetical protein
MPFELNMNGRDHSEDPGVVVKIILDWILGQCGLDLSGSGEGSLAGSCEHGNGPSGPTKCGEFLG